MEKQLLFKRVMLVASIVSSIGLNATDDIQKGLDVQVEEKPTLLQKAGSAAAIATGIGVTAYGIKNINAGSTVPATTPKKVYTWTSKPSTGKPVGYAQEEAVRIFNKDVQTNLHPRPSMFKSTTAQAKVATPSRFTNAYNSIAQAATKAADYVVSKAKNVSPEHPYAVIAAGTAVAAATGYGIYRYVKSPATSAAVNETASVKAVNNLKAIKSEITALSKEALKELKGGIEGKEMKSKTEVLKLDVKRLAAGDEKLETRLNKYVSSLQERYEKARAFIVSEKPTVKQIEAVVNPFKRMYAGIVLELKSKIETAQKAVDADKATLAEAAKLEEAAQKAAADKAAADKAAADKVAADKAAADKAASDEKNTETPKRSLKDRMFGWMSKSKKAENTTTSTTTAEETNNAK